MQVHRPVRQPLGAECAGMEGDQQKKTKIIFEGSLFSLSKATYIPVARGGRELPSL